MRQRPFRFLVRLGGTASEAGPPGWPDGVAQQAHVDIDVTDLDDAEAEVIALGARKADTQPDPAWWRVFLDPAGHPFCLCKV